MRPVPRHPLSGRSSHAAKVETADFGSASAVTLRRASGPAPGRPAREARKSTHPNGSGGVAPTGMRKSEQGSCRISRTAALLALPGGEGGPGDGAGGAVGEGEGGRVDDAGLGCVAGPPGGPAAVLDGDVEGVAAVPSWLTNPPRARPRWGADSGTRPRRTSQGRRAVSASSRMS